MKLTFIGHAGFLIEYKKTLLLIDPWLSPHGAYDSAWLQFPCNHSLGPIILKKCEQFDTIYIYLSHEHKDHCDLTFLFELQKSRPDTIGLIPNFKSKTFLHELRQSPLQHIIEFSNEEHYQANEMDFCFFIDETGINHDSAILVKAGGHSFLNFNDCKIFDRLEYIKHNHGHIDVFAAQFSGASWHPICYDMPESEYQAISKRKKFSKYRAIVNALKILQPKRYLPTAGPPALLDPMHYNIHFQKDTVFPQQFDVIDFLSTFNLTCHLDAIMPGDVYCFNKDDYEILAPLRISDENYKIQLEQYALASRYLFEKNEKTILDSLEKLYQRYFQLIKTKAENFFIQEVVEQRLYFAINEIKQHYIEVNLNQQLCRTVDALPEDNYYFVTYPAWQIQRLVDGYIRGEDLTLTFRGRMKRRPNIYNTWISCFTNSEVENMAANIKLIEAIRENHEKIVVECLGVRYQIKRYCPHQGADLQYGWAEGSHWVCPKHRWHYNLEKSGECTSAPVSICAVEVVDS